MARTSITSQLLERIEEMDARISRISVAVRSDTGVQTTLPEPKEEWFEGLEVTDPQRRFLFCLSQPEAKGRYTQAARLSGVSIRSHYNWMDESTSEEPNDYRKGVEIARKVYHEMLMDAAVQRACLGTDEPVYYLGDVVGYKKRFSDTLLVKLLESELPGKFRSTSENTAGLVFRPKVIELEPEDREDG